MIFQNAVPILYAEDVEKSLAYYVEVLGFKMDWLFGTPPTMAGVSRNAAEIYFCKQAQGHPGTWIWVQLDDIDTYFQLISNRGAKILSTPETMDWGMREMLVEDPDGHRIRFAQNVPLPQSTRKTSNTQGDEARQENLQKIRLIDRKPTVSEFRELHRAMGRTSPQPDKLLETALSAAFHVIVAEETNTNKLIGCVLLLGDWGDFYYVKDVMVHPDWQGQGVGSMIMKALSEWIDLNLSQGSSVWLHTGAGLAPFYKQFGFAPTFGMYRTV